MASHQNSPNISSINNNTTSVSNTNNNTLLRSTGAATSATSSSSTLTRDTAASRSRAQSNQTSLQRQIQEMQQQMEFIDVRDEVERMYRNVLTSMGEEREDQPTFHHSPSTSSGLRGRSASGTTNAASPRCPCGRFPCPCRSSAIATSCNNNNDGPCPTCGQDPCPCRQSTTEAALRSLGMSISRLRTNTFGSSRREVASSRVQPSEAPGPGSYGIGGDSRKNFGVATKGGVRWGGSGNHSNNSNTNTATSETTTSSSSAARLRGGAFDARTGSGNLGPGEYYNENAASAGVTGGASKNKSGGSWSRSSTNRQDVKPSATPGPGAYDSAASSSARDRDGASSSGRNPSSARSETSSARQLQQQQNAGFGSSSARLPDPKTDAPGPNSYPKATEAATNSKSRAPAPSFSSAKRELHPEAEDKKNFPGPQSYDATTADGKNVESSTRQRSTSRSRNGSPTKNPSHAATSARRTDEGFVNRDAVNVPGPGSYDVNGDKDGNAVLMLNNGHSFGRAAQPSSTPLSGANQPGPQSYTIREGVHVGGGVLPLAPRRTDPSSKDASERPGPTSYERSETTALALRPRAASPVIGKQTRDPTDKDKIANPGPGAYNNHENNVIQGDGHGAVTFSQVKRPLAGGLVIVDHTKQPGPGNYDAPHMEVIRDAPKRAVIGDADRFPEASTKTPAPGSYDYLAAEERERLLRGVSIPNADRQGMFDPKNLPKTPGPLAYENAAAPLTVGPRATFGKALKEPTQEKLYEMLPPGPQHYDTTRFRDFGSDHPGQTIPQATRDMTNEKDRNDLVGPASYDPEGNQRRFIPGAALTTALRRTIEPLGCTSEDIGPASYEPKPLHSGPAAVIGTAPYQSNEDLQNDAAARPGPGSYDLPDMNRDARAFSIGNGPGHHNEGNQDNGIPGPASYDVLDHLGSKNNRAASIGNAPRDTVGPEGTQRDNPGPASYDAPDPSRTSQMRTAPSVSISFAPARPDGQEGGAGPGPAMYDVRYDTQGRQVPFVSIGNAPRFNETIGDRDIPGPATYDVLPENFGQYGPAASFGNGPRTDFTSDAIRKDIPGPASYDLPPLAQTPSVSFGFAPRSGLANPNDVPGPASYDLGSTLANLDNAPGFGTAPRNVYNPQDKIPGPNHYFVPVSSLNQRAASFDGPARDVGGALEVMKRAIGDFPEPGHYDPYNQRGNGAGDATSLGDAVNIFFGTAPRDIVDRDKEAAPGPGYYQLPDFASRGVTFTRALPEFTRELDEAAQKPGPGYYQLPETNEGRAPMFGTQICDRNPAACGDKEAPGPGYYALPELPPVHPGVSMKGRNFLPDPASDNPGPGYYHVAYETDPSRGPSIGTGSRQDVVAVREAAEKPGPGHYDINHQDWDRGVKIGTASNRQEDNFNNPGPGQYDLNDMLRDGSTMVLGRGTLIGKADRWVPTTDADAPGPGQYSRENEAPWVKTVLIGTASRFENAATHDVPGPGHYELAGTLDHGRAVSFGNADPQSAEDLRARIAAGATPGPAQYSLPNYDLTGLRAPAWTIVSKPPPADAMRDVPGPGYYHVDGDIENNRGPSIGTAIRGDIVATREAAEKPGPGQYDSRSSYDAVNNTRQAITIKFRQAVPGAGDDVPGPNHYSTANADVLRFPATPIWSIGKAPAHMFAANDNGVPGPNFYALPDLRDQQGVPFLTAERFPDPSNQDVPGPTTYSFQEPIPGPHISFGKDGMTRSAAEIDIAPHSPGAKYNPSYVLVDRNQPAYTIPKGADHLQTKPPATQADYNLEDEAIRGPHWSFGKAVAHPYPHSESPGPIYTVPPPKPPPQWTFTRDMRFHDPPNQGFPGPGDYNPPSAVPSMTTTYTTNPQPNNNNNNNNNHHIDMSKSNPQNVRIVMRDTTNNNGTGTRRSTSSLNSAGSANKSGFVRAKVISESLPGSPVRLGSASQQSGDQVGVGVSPATPHQYQGQQQQSPLPEQKKSTSPTTN